MKNRFDVKKYNPELTITENSRILGIARSIIYAWVYKLGLKRKRDSGGALRKFNIELWDETKTIAENAVIQGMAYSSMNRIIRENKLKVHKEITIKQARAYKKRKPKDHINIENLIIPKHR